MEWFNKWTNTLYNTFIVDDRYKTLITGFEKTILITLGALALGVVIGTIVAVIKVFADGNKKLRPLDFLCNIYLTIIRGTPVVVQLLISFFIIFVSSKDGTVVAIITFGVNSGDMLPRPFVPALWLWIPVRWKQVVLWVFRNCAPCNISSCLRLLKISCRPLAMK